MANSSAPATQERFEQFIDPKYDPDTIEFMSRQQNGKIEIQMLKDAQGNVTGYISLNPIDLSQYTAIRANYVKEGLVNYTNAFQWSLATGGYTVIYKGKTITFPTTSEGLNLISGKDQRLSKPNPPAIVSWQVPGTTDYVDFEAADFSDIAVRIVDFIQATFDFARSDVFPNIENGTFKTTDQVDKVAWPTNSYTFPDKAAAPASNGTMTTSS